MNFCLQILRQSYIIECKSVNNVFFGCCFVNMEELFNER
jgi:hypothetical protein